MLELVLSLLRAGLSKVGVCLAHQTASRQLVSDWIMFILCVSLVMNKSHARSFIASCNKGVRKIFLFLSYKNCSQHYHMNF